MSYLSRQNPFIRTSLLNIHQKEKTIQHIYQQGPQTKNSQLSMYRKSNYQSAEHYADNLYSNHKGIDKSQVGREDLGKDRQGYQGTFFPLSRYQNRLKLRQYDKQIWKRQKSKQERYKLEHFGSEALRYSSYSIAASLDTKESNYWNKDNQKGNKKTNQNRNQYQRYFNASPKQQTNPPNTNQYYSQPNQSKNGNNHNLYPNQNPQVGPKKPPNSNSLRDRQTNSIGYHSSPYNQYMLQNQYGYHVEDLHQEHKLNKRTKNASNQHTNHNQRNRNNSKQLGVSREVQNFQKSGFNDSFSKNNHHIHYQRSQQRNQYSSKVNQSLQSSDNDLIGDDMHLQIPGKGAGSKMSYGSNLESVYRKENMGNRDSINQHESSLQNEQYRKVFGGEKEKFSFNRSDWGHQEQKSCQVPPSIIYLNREYFNIKL